MRTCKRTFFNVVFQPLRIGKQLRYKGVRLIKNRKIKKTVMQKERRSHVGSRNIVFNKFAVVTGLKLRRTFKNVKRGGSSIFVKRARYYAER